MIQTKNASANKFWIAASLTLVILLVGCGGNSPKSAKLDRDFSIPLETNNGYIYGQIGHFHKFGNKFKITFKNRTADSKDFLPIEVFSSDGDVADFFVELQPGEYLLKQVVPAKGIPIDIPTLKKDEHREFFVETGKITYVGSWIFSEDSLNVVDNKTAQDDYMRINYKNILTTGVMSSLP